MTFEEYQQLPNKEWWQITDRGYWDAGAASRDAEIAELVAALEKQIAHDKAVSFERCPDCDYPQKCSRESGCHDIKNYSPIANAALAKVRKP